MQFLNLFATLAYPVFHVQGVVSSQIFPGFTHRAKSIHAPHQLLVSSPFVC